MHPRHVPGPDHVHDRPGGQDFNRLSLTYSGAFHVLVYRGVAPTSFALRIPKLFPQRLRLLQPPGHLHLAEKDDGLVETLSGFG